MSNQDYPLVNQIVPSWADISVKATPTGGALITMNDIASVKRERTVTVGEQQGASGGRVMARTTGSVKYTFSWTLYRSGHSLLLENLAPIAPKRGIQARISLVHFNVQVQHMPPGSVRPYEWRAKGVRVLGDSADAGEGDDADKVEVPCSTIEVVDVIKGLEVLPL
jgi:hypothetical protein